MLITYGIFGVFANIALFVHIAFIFAGLVLLGATLTLPGIAGIVLTIGMAVDSNVLIYERIREEAHLGRSIVSALDAGFKRAFATIVDSNVTMFVAAAILYFLGSGPVRGFAVSLALGILTSIVTAVTMTRMMIALWYRYKRPTKCHLRLAEADVCAKVARYCHAPRRRDKLLRWLAKPPSWQKASSNETPAPRAREHQISVHALSPRELSVLGAALDYLGRRFSSPWE